MHDRDPLDTRVFGEILEGGGVQPIRLPPKSPNLNAYAERFVRSMKEECLSRVVPLGEGHVRLLVGEYVEHDHRERNHQGLDNQLLQRPPPPVSLAADVQRRERLGGLLNFYHREAASSGRPIKRTLRDTTSGPSSCSRRHRRPNWSLGLAAAGMHLEVGLLLQHLDRNEGPSIFSREPDLRPTVVPRAPDRLDDAAEPLHGGAGSQRLP